MVNTHTHIRRKKQWSQCWNHELTCPSLPPSLPPSLAGGSQGQGGPGGEEGPAAVGAERDEDGDRYVCLQEGGRVCVSEWQEQPLSDYTLISLSFPPSLHTTLLTFPAAGTIKTQLVGAGDNHTSTVTRSTHTHPPSLPPSLSLYTVLTSPAAGTIKTLLVSAGDNIAGGDLVVEIE